MKAKSSDTIDNVDIDRIIDDNVENPGNQNIWVYHRQSVSNPVVFLLDTNFSMSGIKLIMAGMTVGILTQLIPSRGLSIVGFHIKLSPRYTKTNYKACILGI